MNTNIFIQWHILRLGRLWGNYLVTALAKLQLQWNFDITNGQVRVRDSEVLFHMSYYFWGKENCSLYRGLRVRRIELEVPLFSSAIMVSAVFLRARYLCKRRAYSGYGKELFVTCLITNWILISFGRPIRPLTLYYNNMV